MSFKVSRFARSAVKARLANTVSGFNPRLTAALADAGLTTLAPGFTLPLSFADDSKNFFQADLDETDFERSTAFTFPFLTLYTIKSTNTHEEKFRSFDGVVVLGMSIYVSWTSSGARRDMESVVDCFEEALYQTFDSMENNPEATGQVIAEWANAYSVAAGSNFSLVYNGDLDVARGKIKSGGHNWVQPIYAQMTVEVGCN
jgi:hypothetical protein